VEIERKFLVRRAPEDLESYPMERLEQAYLSTDPVIRVRRTGKGFVLTCKGPGMLSREEFELPISQEAYEHLLQKAEGRLIVKDRFRIPWEGWTIELDRFAPPLEGLVFAEVEFSSEEEARAFRPPEWFGEDVTYDRRYSNAALSREGPP